MNVQEITYQLKEKARELGFSGIAVARAERLDEEAKRLEDWLNQGFHGTMSYMEDHFEKRVDPTQLVPGAKSVISLLYNYHQPNHQAEGAPRFSVYAHGKDYHKVVRKKLKKLFASLRTIAGDVEGRVFVDSAPVLERDWARRSGLGWVGKNTLLIHPEKGSFFFLAEIICDLELSYDAPMRDYCGTCRRCIDACPTEAISQSGYVLDAQKCISYLTIEHKEEIPAEFKGKMADFVFGCDICQTVCPWNRFATPHTEEAFHPSEEFLQMDRQSWRELEESTFERLFNGSAVKRTKFTGLKRNLNFVID